jgi:hypothetical protein
MAHLSSTDKLAEAVMDREQSLRSKRSNWDNLWQQVSRYVMPDEATFTETITPGHERTRSILDSTAPRSLELFASFLHTVMNNPSQQWFSFRLADTDKPTSEEKQWLEAGAKEALRKMVAARVYGQLHETLLGLGNVGTAVLYVEGAPDPGLRIRNFHLGDCVLDEGDDGNIDSNFRQMMRTPRQALQRWGEDAGRNVQQALTKNDGQPIRYIHAVFPMDEPHLGELVPSQIRNLGAPFASVWVNTGDGSTVSAGHYHEFPYMIPRWYRTSNEMYGRSPAMSVLPAIRMANRMLETILRGAEKLVDPPLLLPGGMMLSPVRLFPGSISYSDGHVKPEVLIPPGASRIEVGNAMLERTQTDIEKGFFVPLFMDIDEKVKTATQVLQEADERNRAVSPMLMRTQTELYDPFVRRSTKVLERGGHLPEQPPGMEGREITVDYASPLVASQRQIEGLSIARLFEGLAPWAGVNENLFDRIDTDILTEILHAANGASAKLLRTDDAVRRIREGRQAQEEQAQQMATLEQGAGAAADLMTASSKLQ